MIPCCRRFTRSTSRTCGSMSPDRKPRSMIPMPPSSAIAIAISARVIVSMLAETIGRCSRRRVENWDERSIDAGSRRSITLYCGVKRKSSNVQPWTSWSKSDMTCRGGSLDPPGRLLRPEERLVVPVVLAEELVHAVVLGKEWKRTRDEPRTGKHIRVLDDGFVFQRAQIRPPESFDDVKRFGRAIAVDLAFLEADGIDDQRVAIPLARRMSHPERIGIRRVR